MKRFFITGMLLTFLFTGTAFAAERETTLLVDGTKKELQHPLWVKDGKTLIAAEDIAEILGGTLEEEDHCLHLQIEQKEDKEDTVWLDKSYDFFIMKKQSPYWRGPLQGYAGPAGVWYMELRETADATDMDTIWKRTAEGDVITLNGARMPRLSMEVFPNTAENTVTLLVQNGEPQSFTAGEEYFLQKWNGECWERMPLVNDMDIDGISIGIPGNWYHYDNEKENGRNSMTYRLYPYGDALEAGRYRVCLPIVYEMMNFPFSAPKNSDITTETNGEILKEWQMFYKTANSKPAFFTRPAEEGHRSRTGYVLAGEFEVK